LHADQRDRRDGQVVRVLAPAGFQAEPDLPVWLRLAPAALRFYDPETRLSLDLGTR
jgi:hypothetical protein